MTSRRGRSSTSRPPLNGDAQFATNILALKNTYGCDIIVDDITYLNEGRFQDGVIAQAVNAVKAAGKLFFSSAGNSGRKDAGTSGTWEGDFLDSGTSIAIFTGTAWQGLPIHSFNGLTGVSAANANPLTADAPSAITLKWSDPLGGAVTDYDLFLLDSALTTVFDASIDDQTVGGEDPYEIMGFGLAGERIVVVRWSGPTKALRLDTNRGRLSISTAGAIVGHNGGESTISVAATDGRHPRAAATLRRRGGEPGRDLQLGRSPADVLQPERDRDHPRQGHLRHGWRPGAPEAGHHRGRLRHHHDPGLHPVLRHLRRRSPRRRHRGPPEVRRRQPVRGPGPGCDVRDRPRRRPRRTGSERGGGDRDGRRRGGVDQPPRLGTSTP